MATSKLRYFFSLIALVVCFNGFIEAATPASTRASDFIKTSCRATLYPALCVQSLMGYANIIQQSPHQLALVALSVSLDRAKSTRDFVARSAKFTGLKRREYEAIEDCFEEMEDSMDRLSQSMKEMESIGESNGQEFLWRTSNVQTWVSAALTNDVTCMDGYSSHTLDGHLKNSINGRVLSVARHTSNALALVNNYASKQ